MPVDLVDLVIGNMPLALTAAGLVLMAMEAVSPGAHLIVIGVAFVGAGAIGLLFPSPLSPLVLAALVLAIGAAATYVYREFDFYGGKGTARTSDSGSLAGATGYATEAITPRGGEVKLDNGGFNPHYSARTTTGRIEEGEEIIVLDPGGGNVLTVEQLGSIQEDDIDRALAREREDSAAEVAGSDPESGATDGTTETETETETETSNG